MRESQMLTIKINKEILKELGFSLEGPVNIPDTIRYQNKEYLVTKIERNGFRGCRKMTSVSIPAAVTEIESGAFYRCSKLAKIEFRGEENNQLRIIGERAICYTRLTEITLPDKVHFLGRYALADNTFLLHINLPHSLSIIEAFAFSNCANVEEIEIPDSVASLGTHMFDGDEGLISVKLSCNMHTLEEGTFLDCWNLTELILPEGLKKINLKAFDGCANIKHISLPSTIEVIQGQNWLWQSCQQYFSYNGTKEEWRDMWAMYNYHQLPLHQTIRCLDGNIRNI